MPKNQQALYICLVPVEFDHVRYGPDEAAGDEVELTDAQARQLLEVNAVKLKEVATDEEAAPAPAAKAAAAAAAKPAAKK